MPNLNFKKVDSSSGNFNSGDILFVNSDKGIYVVESNGSKTQYNGVNSDWQEDNPASKAYILNRTHYAGATFEGDIQGNTAEYVGDRGVKGGSPDDDNYVLFSTLAMLAKEKYENERIDPDVFNTFSFLITDTSSNTYMFDSIHLWSAYIPVKGGDTKGENDLINLQFQDIEGYNTATGDVVTLSVYLEHTKNPDFIDTKGSGENTQESPTDGDLVEFYLREGPIETYRDVGDPIEISNVHYTMYEVKKQLDPAYIPDYYVKKTGGSMDMSAYLDFPSNNDSYEKDTYIESGMVSLYDTSISWSSTYIAPGELHLEGENYKNLTLTPDSIQRHDASGDTYNISLPSNNGTLAITSDIPTDASIGAMGYIKSYTETDPIFTASAAYGITSANITTWNNKQNALTWDTAPTENSTNPVTSGGLYTVITTNELVTSTALNDLDSRVSTLEENSGSGGITTETDPVFTASAAYGITASDITNWNNKVSNVQSDWNATTGAAVILNKPTIPTQTTDASVAAWGYIKTITDASISALGYTKNAGTLTGVKFNGTDASITNGVAAITANIPIEVIEIIGDPDSITSVPAGTFVRCGELVDENKSIILRFKYYANSNDAVDYILTTINVSGNSYSEFWFSDASGYSSVGIFSNDSLEIYFNNYLQGVTFNGTAATVTNSIAAISETDPIFSASPAAGITASDITNWNGKTSNTGTITGITMNGASKGTSGVVDLGTVITSHAKHKLTTTNGTATAGGSTITYVESLTGTTTATDGDLSLTATRKSVTIPSEVTESTVSGWGFTKNTGTLTTETDPVFSASAAAGITSSNITTWNGKQDAISDLATIRSNASAGAAKVSANNSTITIQKNGTTVDSFTTNASSAKTINMTVNELPTVSASDNGKILQVVNGQWTLVTPVSIYNGSGEPSNILGNNGDIYIQS